jgi:hypothetical protein
VSFGKNGSEPLESKDEEFLSLVSSPEMDSGLWGELVTG